MNQHGFTVFEILIVGVVLGLIGLLSYNFYTLQNNKAVDSSVTSQSPVTNSVPAAPKITTTGDLDTAATMLEQADTSSDSDSAYLDTQFQSF